MNEEKKLFHFGYPRSKYLESIDKIAREYGQPYASDRDREIWVRDYHNQPMMPLGITVPMPQPICLKCPWYKCFDKCYQYRFRSFTKDPEVLSLLISILGVSKKSIYAGPIPKDTVKAPKVPWSITFKEGKSGDIIEITGTRAFTFINKNRDLFDKHMNMGNHITLVKPARKPRAKKIN